MADLLILILTIIIVAAVVSAVVLPIVALLISISSRKKLTEELSKLRASSVQVLGSSSSNSSEGALLAAIQQLKVRIEEIEMALRSHSIPLLAVPVERESLEIPEHLINEAAPQIERAAVPQPADMSAFPITPEQTRTSVKPAPSFSPARIGLEQIESIIGSRWLGWAAVCVILFAAAFFLKYAFENRWIGELGRVAIGVAAGISMTVFGFKYNKRNWRVFSQILSSGGIVLLYLSVYAAFGYYHLATQTAAFVFLAILIAEAAGLAYLYNAPAIAIMALVGGFLTPILLRSDRDQYRSLFAYIAGLDIGALALLKHWTGLSSLAFVGTHLLFWLWYGGNYHPHKLLAVMIFQGAVFLIFLLAHLGRQLMSGHAGTIEDIVLLLINPFVFFSTAHHLLNANHHDWMGVFAIGMALIYAGTAKVLLDRRATTPTESLFMVGIALTLVTIAIPIQLRANWITIAWSVEALLMLWAGLETRARWLRILGCALFALSFVRLLFWDTPGASRPIFTPVLNKYFLSSLVVTACLFLAAAIYQRLARQKEIFEQTLRLIILLAGIVTLWFIISVETHTYFTARAGARKLAEDAAHERWLGQMGLSVLWSLYAGMLAAVGLMRRSASVRWTALSLFALAVIKAMLVDIAELQQLYRIIVFFVLGVLLLVVAWGYHKAFYSREASK
ncbi:MAG TPA: DUF2339 domain-containing protein [Pyrinomonadaceae bacterium]|nr:DUF2339 domain-containing protein [Pyrinomonadaceae bacterium]